MLSDYLRRVLGLGAIADTFNRSVASGLGSTSTGSYPWQVMVGSWSVNGSRPVTSTSHTSNPIAVVESYAANIEASLTIGAGDALYFRVVDSNDWWRLLWEGYQTTSCSTCCSSCCSTCCNTCSSVWYTCCTGPDHNCTSCTGCGTCTCNCSQYGDGFGGTKDCLADNVGGSNACSYSCNCYSCNCYSCNCSSCNCVDYNNYRMRVQRMTAGSLSTMATGGVTTATSTRARVVTNGNSIQAYYGSSGTTLLYNSADTTHSGATKHGVGRGASNYNTSLIDNFNLSWS